MRLVDNAEVYNGKKKYEHHHLIITAIHQWMQPGHSVRPVRRPPVPSETESPYADAHCYLCASWRLRLRLRPVSHPVSLRPARGGRVISGRLSSQGCNPASCTSALLRDFCITIRRIWGGYNIHGYMGYMGIVIVCVCSGIGRLGDGTWGRERVLRRGF